MVLCNRDGRHEAPAAEKAVKIRTHSEALRSVLSPLTKNPGYVAVSKATNIKLCQYNIFSTYYYTGYPKKVAHF